MPKVVDMVPITIVRAVWVAVLVLVKVKVAVHVTFDVAAVPDKTEEVGVIVIPVV